MYYTTQSVTLTTYVDVHLLQNAKYILLQQTKMKHIYNLKIFLHIFFDQILTNYLF